MTALQQLKRKNRRLNNNELRSRSSVASRLFGRKAKSKMQKRFEHSRRHEQALVANDTEPMPLERLPIGALCESAMRGEIEHLFTDQGGRRCSMLHIVSTLLESSDVKTSYAVLPAKDAQGSSSFRETVARFFLEKQMKEIRRKYELVNHLGKIRKQPSCSTTHVGSWSEAKSALEVYLSFPECDDSERLELDAENAAVSLAEDTTLTNCLNKMRVIDAQSRMDNDLPVSSAAWRKLSHTRISELHYKAKSDLDQESIMQAERDAYEGSKKPDALALIEERMREEQEREARERMANLMRPLDDDEYEIVQEAIFGEGDDTEVLAKSETDSVQRQSLRRLAPGQWLNDEVISYFLLTLIRRDEIMCQEDATRKRSHFFKSFFITKLFDEGNSDPSKDGVYNFKNVKRWSKKVPGKDIFNLNCIVCPVNMGNMHWTCAVAFMQEKRIQYYDSFGGDGMHYIEGIFRYIKDEHQAKKGGPLPDADSWQLVPCTSDTPRQLNGFDCGVFTCMFADFLSKGCPLVFDQTMITQCRERIALAVMKGTAIM